LHSANTDWIQIFQRVVDTCFAHESDIV